MSFKKIGDYIQIVNNKNKDLITTNLLGVNIFKNFMPSVANTSGLDLSKYKLITKGQFATNLMHVNRDEVLPVALYQIDKPAIVSPAYITFEVKDENKLLPEYLMMEFQRLEFDRRAWTYCDSSVRGGLEWERLCDIEIPIPNIGLQRKFVAIYNGLMINQKVYQNSLEDLQLICDTYIENLIKTEEQKLLGEYLERTEEKNWDNNIREVMGMSTQKKFRVPQSRVNLKELSNYRIVRNRDFAYVPTTDTWRCLAVALSDFAHNIVVSPIYITFRVKDLDKLLPEYLFLFLKREEFDRYARFHSWGSARENFNWEDLCNIKLPIPNIKVQEAIVTIYHTLETRKRINEQLKNTIKPLCPVLMKGVVESVKLETVNP